MNRAGCHWFEDADQRLTRRQFLKHWPQDFPAPNETTLRRRLDRAVREFRVLRNGTGRKNAPYRYCLPAKAEAWRADPIHPDNLAAWLKAQRAEFVEGRTAVE
jgi:hypothetical protein